MDFSFSRRFCDEPVDTFEDRVCEEPPLHAYYKKSYLEGLIEAEGWKIVSYESRARLSRAPSCVR